VFSSFYFLLYIAKTEPTDVSTPTEATDVSTPTEATVTSSQPKSSQIKTKSISSVTVTTAEPSMFYKTSLFLFHGNDVLFICTYTIAYH
jgi:hypothetical protein